MCLQYTLHASTIHSTRVYNTLYTVHAVDAQSETIGIIHIAQDLLPNALYTQHTRHQVGCASFNHDPSTTLSPSHPLHNITHDGHLAPSPSPSPSFITPHDPSSPLSIIALHIQSLHIQCPLHAIHLQRPLSTPEPSAVPQRTRHVDM